MGERRRGDGKVKPVEMLAVATLVVVVAVVAVLSVGFFTGSGEPSATDREFEEVVTAFSAMMVANNLSELPNPATLDGGEGAGGCATGTRDMSTFPDAVSAAGSASKQTDRDGNPYQEGDGDGYVLFRHDGTGDNSADNTINFLETGQAAYCYSVTADGWLTQYDISGNLLNPR